MFQKMSNWWTRALHVLDAPLPAGEEKPKPAVVVKRWFETFVHNNADDLAAGGYVRIDWPENWTPEDIKFAETCILWQDDFSHSGPCESRPYDVVSYRDPRESYFPNYMSLHSSDRHVEWHNPELNRIMQSLLNEWKQEARHRVLQFIADYGDRLKANEAVELVYSPITMYINVVEGYIDGYAHRILRKEMGLYFDDDGNVVTRPPVQLPQWQRELKQMKKKQGL